MTRKLIIETSPAETRAALLEDDTITGFWFSGGQTHSPVCLGRVNSIDTALDAAFVDIGGEEDGFLPLADAARPDEGQLIPVQIKRPAMDGKGPLLTRDLSLETLLLRWRPLAGKRQLVIARDITAAEERSRLQQALDDKGFKGELTIRPFAGGIAADALREAFTHLRQSHDAALETGHEAQQPGVIAGTRHPALTALLHFADRIPQEIIVSGADAMRALHSSTAVHLAHRHLEIISSKSLALFEEMGAEEALEIALQRTVMLPAGGRLVFDEAEALTAIDVDVAATPGQSKRGAIQRACLEAVPEIIRQLRLRQIGGQAVIDFPALAVKGGGQLASLLKSEIRKIPGGRFGRIDQNGLAILILPRKGLSLLDQFTTPEGSGPVPGRRFSDRVIAARALRMAEAALAEAPSDKIGLSVAPAIKDYIESQPGWVAPLNDRYAMRLAINAITDFQRDQIDVKAL